MLRRVIGGALRAIVGKHFYTRVRIGSLLEHSYLRKVPGIIHIGANTGQERDLYAAFGLHVVLARGFRERRRIPFMQMPGVGTCYDMIYERAR